MKRTLIFLGVLFTCSILYAEDGPKLRNAEVSYGDSAFTSGLNISLNFLLSQKKTLELVGNSERFYSTLNFKMGDKLSLDVTGGVFKKLPWVGPRVVYYPIKPVMFLYWGGWSSGRIGKLSPEVKSFCQQFSLYVSPAKNLSVGYNAVKIDVYKTTQLPEIAYRYNVLESISIGASVTYDLVERKPLFSMSAKYIFP
jgi:hypothetical protein